MAARTGRAALACVIGHPVAHSLSPALHEYWLGQHDIDGAYIPLAVPAEFFEETLNLLWITGFRGGNVTVPHKERAFAAAAALDESARLSGAVNTLVRREEGGFLGKNTDVEGFINNLKEGGVDPATIGHTLVLGAGGAARAVAVGLALEGCAEITFVNRTRDRAEALCADLSTALPRCRFTAQPWEDRHRSAAQAALLVNSTTLGMAGHAPLAFNVASLPPHAAVCDIVYRPLETPLLAEARAQGRQAIGGLGMLIHQAAPGFEAWFGIRPRITPEVAEMLCARMAA